MVLYIATLIYLIYTSITNGTLNTNIIKRTYLIYTSITNGTLFSYYYLFNLHINN